MGSTIFQGNFVKTLKSQFNIGDAAHIQTGTTDPRVSAVDAPAGSLYIKTDTAEYFKKLDAGSSTNWEELGAGGASGINYVDNPDFETGDDGWALYDDGVVAVPVDGTGGSPSALSKTVTSTASEVLRGTKSLKLSKSTADAQGEGLSYDLVDIDRRDEGETLYFSFDYETSANYQTGDFVVYVYDIDGTSVAAVSPVSLEQAPNKAKFTGSFVTTSGNNSYRIILHTATSRTGAGTDYNVFVDNVVVGPAATIQAPVVTEWQSYVPTFTNFTSTQDSFFWRRVGDSMEIKGAMEVASVSGSMSFSLPSGYSLDTAKLEGYDASTTSFTAVGHATANDGSVNHDGIVQQNSSSTTDLRIVNRNEVNGTPWDTGVPFTWSAADYFNVDNVVVPISGWGAGAVVSTNELSTQTVNFGAYRTTSSQTATAGASTEVVFNAERHDSHGGFSTSTGRFTAPRKGLYSFRSNVVLLMGATAASDVTIAFKKNGTGDLLGAGFDYDLVANDYYAMTAVADIEMNQGDYVSLFIIPTGQNVSIVHSGGSNDTSSFYGHSLPSFTTYGVAKGQVINCRYTRNSTLDIGSQITIPYDDVDYDNTNGAYNSTTGVFTAQVPGKYRVTAGYFINGAATGVNRQVRIEIHKNGTAQTKHTVFYSNENSPSIRISDTVNLAIGDTVEIEGFTNDDFDTLIATDATYNFLTIEKID